MIVGYTRVTSYRWELFPEWYLVDPDVTDDTIQDEEENTVITDDTIQDVEENTVMSTVVSNLDVVGNCP